MFTPNAIMRSIPLDRVTPCVDILLTLFHKLGYTGLFMAEFKQDPRDSVFKLLEVNARSAGDNHFMLACGVNHVLAAYHDALQEPVSPTPAYRTGVYNINLKNDLYLSVHRILHGRWESQMLVPYLHPHHWHSVSIADPLPFVIKMLKG
jgi:predicted ATP-grasp superfamily ATP-dependent carboligase